MKVFQVLNNICHWDATRKHPTLESTVGFYAPNIIFIEAPDTVFEGWGYVNGEFIQPPFPEPSSWTTQSGEIRQWMYDTETGTFYIADAEGNPIQPEDLSATIADMQSALQTLGVEKS